MFAKISSIRMAILSAMVVLGSSSVSQAQSAAAFSAQIENVGLQYAAQSQQQIALFQQQVAYTLAIRLVHLPPAQRPQSLATLQHQNPQLAAQVLFYYQRLLVYGR